MSFWTLSSSIDAYLIVAAALLGIGVFGLLYHSTVVGMLIAGELIFAGASLNFMAFSHFSSPDPVTGQVFNLFIMGLAAAEAAIVLSLLVAVYRDYRSVSTKTLDDLKG